MNSSLLKHGQVKQELSRLIDVYWQKAQNDVNYGRNWELLKLEIGKYLRKYGSDLAKSRRRYEEEVISGITSLSCMAPENLSDTEKLRLTELEKNCINTKQRVPM